MNQDDIIRMAREAGGDDWGIFRDFMPEIERFAGLVAAEEREACAKVCDEQADEHAQLQEFYELAAVEALAEHIRARGNNEK